VLGIELEFALELAVELDIELVVELVNQANKKPFVIVASPPPQIIFMIWTKIFFLRCVKFDLLNDAHMSSIRFYGSSAGHLRQD